MTTSPHQRHALVDCGAWLQGRHMALSQLLLLLSQNVSRQAVVQWVVG
jgi:hypothetical protein